jgi:hypothetical protein
MTYREIWMPLRAEPIRKATHEDAPIVSGGIVCIYDTLSEKVIHSNTFFPV